MKLVFGWRRFAVAALMAALMSVPVMAQGPGGFGRGGGGMMMGRGMMGGGGLLGLLRMDEVQKELKLDEEQTKQIQSQMEKLQEKMQGMRPDFGNFREMTEEQRAEMQKKMEEMGKQMAEAAKAAEAEIDNILDPDQQDRLLGLMMQRDGVRSVMGSEKVAEALGVTAEQKEKLQAAEREAMEEMRSAFGGGRGPGGPGGRGQGGPGGPGGAPGAGGAPGGPGGPGGFDPEAMRKRFEEFRKKSDERLQAILTDAQRQKMDEMKGEKFEFPAPQFGFGGGRGQGGPGGPGGGRRRPGGEN
ncbi:MAG: Spy/CpxP family protein refolding chaperone [Pirellulaceae bacterium]|jgi:hypothetical protein